MVDGQPWVVPEGLNMEQVLDLLLEEQKARLDAAKREADLAAAMTRMAGETPPEAPPSPRQDLSESRAALRGMSSEALSLLISSAAAARGL